MFKKSFIVLLLSVFIITGIAYAANTKFSDIPKEHWGIKAINWGVDKDLVKGFEDGTFKPKKQLSEAEFAMMLGRYAKNTDKAKIKESKEGHWADNVYKELSKWELPFSGYSDNNVRNTGVTRGKIAQIVAAKYGFDLTERQAVYFMYENDISYGMVEGELSFESYNVNDTLNRVMAVEFLRKLNNQGHVTFMGKQGKTSDPSEIIGTEGVSKETVEITDEMFDDLAKKKGVTNPKSGGNNSRYPAANKVADKWGLTTHDYEDGTVLRRSNKEVLAHVDHDNGRSFTVRVSDFGKNKEIALDYIKETGKVDVEEVKGAIKKHLNYIGPPQYWPVTGGQVEVTGDDDMGSHMTIRIYLYEE